MASRDILVLNTTASRAETQQGSDTVVIRGDSGEALSVENSSGASILSVNTLSSSVDVAGKITATTNVSSSLSSTGSFGRLEATTLVGDAFNLTNTEIEGTISSSGQIANQISGSFKGGFEMIEGGLISSSIKFISSSISSSTTEIGMGQGNDGSTSQSIASASFSIGLADFANLKVNDGAVTALSHRTVILNQGILSKNEKFVNTPIKIQKKFYRTFSLKKIEKDEFFQEKNELHHQMQLLFA